MSNIIDGMSTLATCTKLTHCGTCAADTNLIFSDFQFHHVTINHDTVGLRLSVPWRHLGPLITKMRCYCQGWR